MELANTTKKLVIFLTPLFAAATFAQNIIFEVKKTISSRVYPKIFLLYLAITAAYATAAPVDYRVSFDGVLDNREYHSPLTDQTFFLARGELELGLVLDEYHKIRGGVAYTQEFGALETVDNLHLLLYYHYDNGKNAQFRFGAFPRVGALGLPVWFFGDEAAYNRPIIHGAAVEFGALDGVTLGAWVDWTGRQTAVVNEAFLFGYNVELNHGMAFFRHDFIMYHLAHTRPARPNSAVRDNGGVSVEAGFLLDGNAYFDALLLSAGGIISLDRDRGGRDWYTGIEYLNIAPWHTPIGGFLNGEISKSLFVVKGFFYKGEPQRLYWADDAFSYSGLESYGWLDLGIRFNKKDYIKTELSQKFHLYNNKIGFSQHFLLRVELRKGKV
ncbi:MAG: hypothetical protein LBC70_03140 [Chitinispirillales bacterium]|nr:hypothetical protein [Chitinispirillales bacterium]